MLYPIFDFRIPPCSHQGFGDPILGTVLGKIRKTLFQARFFIVFKIFCIWTLVRPASCAVPTRSPYVPIISSFRYCYFINCLAMFQRLANTSQVAILREGSCSQGATWAACGSGAPPYEFLNLYGIFNSRFCIRDGST